MLAIETMKYVFSTVLLALLMLSAPNETLAARTIDPGSVWITGTLGPRSVFGSRVGGSETYLNLGAEAEYTLQSNLGLTGGLNYGLAGSSIWRLHTGVRHELYNLDSPLSFHGRADLFAGQVRGALGANLQQLGLGLGVSADYNLTRALTARLSMLVDLGSTLGERPASFNTFTMLVAVSHKI